jgi:hypothetical protein
MGTVFTWLLLVILFGVELALAFSHHGGWAPLVGVVMVGVMATELMHIHRGSPLMQIFALAGLFWLTILLGLTAVDSNTRHDHGVGQELSVNGAGGPRP